MSAWTKNSDGSGDIGKMSEELTFEDLQEAIKTIRAKCDHVPINVSGYLWECRCHKIYELRVTPEEINKLKEDAEWLHNDLQSGKITEIFGIKVFVT